MVIFHGWQMGTIFILYWLETYIIWFFTTIKYLTMRVREGSIFQIKIKDDLFLGPLLAILFSFTAFGLGFTFFFRDDIVPGIFYYLIASFTVSAAIWLHELLSKDYKGTSVETLNDINARRGIFFFGIIIVILVKAGRNAMHDRPEDAGLNQAMLIFFVALKIIFELGEFLYPIYFRKKTIGKKSSKKM